MPMSVFRSDAVTNFAFLAILLNLFDMINIVAVLTLHNRTQSVGMGCRMTVCRECCRRTVGWDDTGTGRTVPKRRPLSTLLDETDTLTPLINQFRPDAPPRKGEGFAAYRASAPNRLHPKQLARRT